PAWRPHPQGHRTHRPGPRGPRRGHRHGRPRRRPHRRAHARTGHTGPRHPAARRTPGSRQRARHRRDAVRPGPRTRRRTRLVLGQVRPGPGKRTRTGRPRTGTAPCPGTGHAHHYRRPRSRGRPARPGPVRRGRTRRHHTQGRHIVNAPLPEPERERWQPLRVGLIDLFHYENEQFWFRDGRLLLRGNNGTGKSKVLALTLPFLLDGELSAHRVEPDGDPKKRMEWNLLLGGEHPHGERLGYTWIEFGRRTAEDGTEFRTLGCGLKAVTGRGITRHWYFSTTQRIGDGPDSLHLPAATGTALSRDRLADAVEGHGMVHDRARDHRRAVDEALFGLGEQRYRALVDLLVQLRQPQL